MSTTFGVIVKEKEIKIARRWSDGYGATMRFTNDLAETLPDETPVIPLDNSAQGIYTIGDIKDHIKDRDQRDRALNVVEKSIKRRYNAQIIEELEKAYNSSDEALKVCDYLEDRIKELKQELNG